MIDVQTIDVAAVAARARSADVTVSVVIPALEEESTIGAIVDSIRRDLVDRTGLVDEILVVDDGSKDATAVRAREAGARVIHQSSSQLAAGPGSGKGDAMWKGLAETSGEIVVFLDADLVDFPAAWVAALVSPLVDDPSIVLVKGCYERALGDEDIGGGRVTELLARPLLNAFWPELARLAQPLAGEYAGRRSALERVPFVCGYGVELGLLIDLARLYGADAIAQVDLGMRRHGHQSLDALGRMAAEILATASARLRVEGRLDDDPSPILHQPRRRSDGSVSFDVHDVGHAERPPLLAHVVARGPAATD